MQSPDTIAIGSTIGGFVIEKVLGKGGMGVVYKAHESSLNRKVALKVLSQQLSNDKEFITRFKKEAQIVAALSHPNIVNILTFGHDLGHYYFAMDYIQGRDLDQILRERLVIPVNEALIIARQIADALSEAANRGVVHRDLKPPNIMLDGLNRVRVTDFGVAKVEGTTDNLTKTGMFVGSPQYASPEQAAGKPIDTRSDIYALGAILYRMLAGNPPTTGDSPLAVMLKIISEPVTPIELVNPSVPKPVCELLAKMMAKERDDRYRTPAEVVAAVDSCLRQLTAGPAPAADQTVVDVPSEATVLLAADSQPDGHKVLRRSRRWGRRSMALAGLVGAAVVLGAGISYFSARPAAEKIPLSSPAVVSPGAEKRAAVSPITPPASPTPAPPAASVAVKAEHNPTPPAVSRTESAAPAAGHGGGTLPGESPPAPAANPLPVQQAQVTPAPSAAAAQVVDAVQPPPVAPTVESRVTAPAPRPKKKPKVAPPAQLPATPVVLLLVAGLESLTAPLRVHLEGVMFDSGLPLVSPVEIPQLGEKIQYGEVPITWYEVKELLPAGAAHILVLAKIQKSGSTMLSFYGHSQEQTTATFSLQILDLTTGTAIERTLTGTVQYTDLTINDAFQDLEPDQTGRLGAAITHYWRQKISHTTGAVAPSR